MKLNKSLLLKGLLGLIGVLVLAVIILFIANNPEEVVLDQAARDKTTGEYVALSQGITHYEMAGPDTAQTIVLVHGFSVPYYIWDSTFNSLSARGYRVVRYDTYGRGYSDRLEGEYTAEVYDTQLLDLIRALKLKTPIHLMGLSFGGPVTSYFTAYHPELVKSLTLLDPATRLFSPTLPEFISYVLTVIYSSKLSEQLSDFYNPANFPGWNERYKPQMRYKGFIHALVSSRYHYQGDPVESFKIIAKQKTPVLLIWGRQDTTTPFSGSEIANEILRPQFLPVDEAGHLPHMEKAGVVLPVMLDFLFKQK